MNTKKQIAYILIDMFSGIPFRMLLMTPADQGCQVQPQVKKLYTWRGAKERLQSIRHPRSRAAPQQYRCQEGERSHFSLFIRSICI